MAILDIFKSKQGKAEEKLKRPSKGVLKKPASPAVPNGKQASKSAKKKSVKKDAQIKVAKEGTSEIASMILSAPHITEKASFLSEEGAYVFKVAKRSNKILIKKSIKELYGVEPRKVAIINVPSKVRLSRGRKGVRSGYKKAIVYLKAGDKIEVV